MARDRFMNDTTHAHKQVYAEWNSGFEKISILNEFTYSHFYLTSFYNLLFLFKIYWEFISYSRVMRFLSILIQSTNTFLTRDANGPGRRSYACLPNGPKMLPILPQNRQVKILTKIYFYWRNFAIRTPILLKCYY